jgi:two-component system response regulator DevR
MFGGDGIAACVEIKRVLPVTKIVLITAEPDEDCAFAAALAGAEGYLDKSIDQVRLVHVLQAVLEGETAYPRRFVSRLLAELRRVA